MTDIEDLGKEIEAGRVVVVVGSGVSLAVSGGNKIASWTGLAENGALRCVEVGRATEEWRRERIRDLSDKDHRVRLEAVSSIGTRLREDADEFTAWLRATIGSLQPLPDASLPLLISRRASRIVTTNYDRLLEDVLGFSHVNYTDKTNLLPALLGRLDRKIVHLHGIYSEPDSVILDLVDYGRILGNEQAQIVQQILAVGTTLLFVGCGAGMSDPNIGRLLRWVGEFRRGSGLFHYQLVLDQQVEQARRDLEKFGGFRVIGFGGDYRDLPAFLKDLPNRPGLGMPPEPPAPNPAGARLREFESLVEKLGQYKAIHEVVHNLFATQRKLELLLQPGSEDSDIWSTAGTLVGTIDILHQTLIRMLGSGAFPPELETGWLVLMKFAADRLWNAIDSVGPRPVRKWAARNALNNSVGPMDTLKSTVHLKTVEMNEKMKGTTRLIDIQALIDELMNGPPPPGMTVQQLLSIGAKLQRLDGQRGALMTAHDKGQTAHVALRELEGSLSDDLDKGLTDWWQRASAVVLKPLRNDRGDWTAQMRRWAREISKRRSVWKELWTNLHTEGSAPDAEVAERRARQDLMLAYRQFQEAADDKFLKVDKEFRLFTLELICTGKKLSPAAAVGEVA